MNAKESAEKGREQTMAEPVTTKDHLTLKQQRREAIFFHLPEEPHGYLSNWYPAPFTLDGVRYSSTEQYIMHEKCAIFGDGAAAAAVLATDDPQTQQTIGRNAAGYVHHVWVGLRQMVALRGLLAKFSQNETLKRQLLATGDAWLVECAGSDTNWACGVRLKDAARRDADLWRGDNLLGFALMEARALLRAEMRG